MTDAIEVRPLRAWVPFVGLAELESVGVREDGRALYGWFVQIPSGATVLWELDLTQPVGRMQRAVLVD